MRYSLLVIAGMAVLGACAAPHQIEDRAEYLQEGTRTYSGVTRENVITAAETILKISDPNDWDFRYSENGFTGLRRYFIYAVLASAQGQEKWEFSTEISAPKAITASVTISDQGKAFGGYTATNYEHSVGAIPLYRLFWDRMDYMLGKRPTWVSCDEAEEALKETNTARGALGGLCGLTSQGRNAPAPAPIISMVASGPAR